MGKALTRVAGSNPAFFPDGSCGTASASEETPCAVGNNRGKTRGSGSSPFPQ